MPIMLISWFDYERNASIVAIPILSATAWLLADIYSGHRYSSAWIPYWNMFIRLSIFLLIGVILSRLRASIHNEKMLARIDPLTGVFNSRYFAELAFKEISRSSRFSEPFTFAFVDVDNFKNVNDSHGHHQGDELLKTMTKSIRSRIRDIDIMARLGGDEFGILLPRTDQEESRFVMEKVYSIFREGISSKWKVTLSAGVITFVKPPKSLDEMIKAADALMYSAKKDGKDKAAYAIIREST